MKLGILGRTTIVASGLWMAGGTVYFAFSKSDEAERIADEFYQNCAKNPASGYDCWDARRRLYESHTTQLEGGLWGFSAVQAGLYLVLTLVAFGILYWSIRWILAARGDDVRIEPS